MKKTVAVIGGGIAGMTAAHELTVRGFEVQVYELRTDNIPGGKARSYPAKPKAKGRLGLPAEHGFRFFPRFYEHVTETMKRIRYKDRYVYDNLVDTKRVQLASPDSPPVEILTQFPRSRGDLENAINTMFGGIEGNLALADDDVNFFVGKLWQFITSSKGRRINDYERLGWWEYVGAEGRSQGYQEFFAKGMTRSLVAADPEKANAKVGGDIGVQLLLDIWMPGDSTDRVLNGPTNQVWLDPWFQHIKARGVKYHFGQKVKSLNCVNGEIQSVTFKALLPIAGVVKKGDEHDVKADYYVVALPLEVLVRLLEKDIKTNDHAILKADPSLEGVLDTLKDDLQWMSGIQFYLEDDVPVTPGHTLYLESPWALTSISQRQFWEDDFNFRNYDDGTVEGCLSVDISNWTAESDNTPAAEKCTEDEIVAETWRQVTDSLKSPLLPEEAPRYNLDSSLSFLDEPDAKGRLWSNAEPLYVARKNTWHARPSAYTDVKRLYLAADYVRTNTQVATMEAANEAARRAVNAILEDSKSKASRSRIWPLDEPKVFIPWRLYDTYRYQRGMPWDETPWRVLSEAVDWGAWLFGRFGGRPIKSAESLLFEARKLQNRFARRTGL